jgi:Zn-dependent M28 family amino/carboxypeptidase
LQHVRQLVGIGPRVAGSDGARHARAYIRRQLEALGLGVEEQLFDAVTPLGRVSMANVRAFVPGAAPGTRLIFAGHYDTKRFDDFTFVGANDGGSSAAFLIELARVLAARPNAVPIELLFLDGEEAVVEWVGEDNTYGSRHYVRAARGNGTLKDIGALVLVDMIADRDLRLKRESNSTAWLTDVIWSAARSAGRPEFVDEATPLEDDHLRFLEAGVPAVDIIDLEYPDASNRYWHTREDTLDKVSAASLQAVGDVLLRALPEIEKKLAGSRPVKQ